MYEQSHHEMVMATVHESGAEEWFCPTCGRRFLMEWPPNYKKVILEPGDEFAIHSGGKTDYQNYQAKRNTPDAIIDIDDPSLKIFTEWMDDIDFESFWRQD